MMKLTALVLLLMITLNNKPTWMHKSDAPAATHQMTVEVTDIKNDKGKLAVAVFKDASSFLEKPAYADFVKISNGKASVTFDKVPEGTYAVTVYHDENDNGKLDKNFVGAPKEDYNVSNQAKNTFSAPKWDEAKFSFPGNTGGRIKIRLND